MRDYPPKPSREELLLLLQEHRGLYKAAKAYHVNTRRMRQWMVEYGIVVPPRGRWGVGAKAEDKFPGRVRGWLASDWVDLVYRAWFAGFDAMRSDEVTVAKLEDTGGFERAFEYLSSTRPIGKLVGDERFDERVRR